MQKEIDVNERNNKKLDDLIAPWHLKPHKRYCMKDTNIVNVVDGKTTPHSYIYIGNGIISKVTQCSKAILVDKKSTPY